MAKVILPSLFLLTATGWAEPADLALTIDDYTQRAIEQGIQGHKNALFFETAGYSREIAFRQTDSPNAALALSGTRSESQFTGSTAGLSGGTVGHRWASPNDAGLSSLTINEPLPTGTFLSATGFYDDLDKPGLNLSVKQPLYLFVKNSVMRTRRQAELSYENSKDSFNSTILALRTQARGFYYQVLLREEGIQVEERKAASSKTLNDVTLALVDAGKLAPVEAMRSKIRFQTDERALYNAQIGFEKAVLSAKNFIYLPLDQPVKFLSRLEFNPFTISLQRLLEYALLHRPEIKNLRRAQELAQLDWEAAREPTRPTLSLNGTYGFNQVNDSTSRSWTSGASANWLFFDSFVTDDRTRIARIGKIVADLNLADTERATRLDVQNAYLDIKNAERQIMDFQSSREQARRNIEVLRLRYQNGLDRLIDVFDAETAAHDLDFEYLNLLVGYNSSKDNLAQLVGGDLASIP